MKMKTEHFEALKAMLSGFARIDLQAGREHYRKEGLSSKRYRWDVLYSVPFAKRQEWFDLGIYEYLNDDHIDTALRASIETDW